MSPSSRERRLVNAVRNLDPVPEHLQWHGEDLSWEDLPDVWQAAAHGMPGPTRINQLVPGMTNIGVNAWVVTEPTRTTNHEYCPWSVWVACAADHAMVSMVTWEHAARMKALQKGKMYAIRGLAVVRSSYPATRNPPLGARLEYELNGHQLMNGHQSQQRKPDTWHMA